MLQSPPKSTQRQRVQNLMTKAQQAQTLALAMSVIKPHPRAIPSKAMIQKKMQAQETVIRTMLEPWPDQTEELIKMMAPRPWIPQEFQEILPR